MGIKQLVKSGKLTTRQAIEKVYGNPDTQFSNILPWLARREQREKVRGKK